ncbi:MAG: Fe(3+) dicitrate ABC transporter substrate-binding protein [Cardiobacteriaceae bacterium]|nr:Fe(3+) dicitrate ABC transporter substrate-binding protein [Cardiobacteriaceae bacterium]
MKIYRTLFATLVATTTLFAQAITVKDQKGDFTLETVPQRVVALEYSYVDALAQIGVSPVGVADDKDPSRLLQVVRDKIQPWESVGTRPQPSLEAIAALKPDLIIADDNRHTAVYEELKKIAPTVVFNSRHESYQESLETSQKIGDLLGKSEEMKKRIDEHNTKIRAIAEKMPKGKKVGLGISRENEFHLYNDQSYPGGLLAHLGLILPKATKDNEPNTVIGLEQLVAEKPEVLLISHYREESIAKKWANEALWAMIPAVKEKQILEIDGNLWARARGIDAAEIMAQEVADFLNQSAQ